LTERGYSGRWTMSGASVQSYVAGHAQIALIDMNGRMIALTDPGRLAALGDYRPMRVALSALGETR
jgi:hypothetical protein